MNSGNIIIVGAMGSGKSTVGKLLAKKLDKKYIDTDLEIEIKNNCDISTFFEKYGETLFREKESEILDALTDINNHIISTGGGIILKEENINLLKKIGLIVFLDIGLKAQIKRVKHRKHRPLLKSDDLYTQLKELKKGRDPIYNSISDYIIDVSNKDKNAVVEEICNKLI